MASRAGGSARGEDQVLQQTVPILGVVIHGKEMV